MASIVPDQLGPSGGGTALVLGCVRKHLTGGSLCAVLDLSGSLCSLLIPEYSRIKRRGKPLLGAEESRHFLPHGDKYTLLFYEPYGNISAENSYLVRQYKYLHNVE